MTRYYIDNSQTTYEKIQYRARCSTNSEGPQRHSPLPREPEREGEREPLFDGEREPRRRFSFTGDRGREPDLDRERRSRCGEPDRRSLPAPPLLRRREEDDDGGGERGERPRPPNLRKNTSL